MKFHRNQFEAKWTCTICKATFKEQRSFEDHLESFHRIFVDQPIYENLIAVARRIGPQVFIDQSCPLCYEMAGETPTNFAKHVGKHMEGIALAVLPQGSDSDSDSDQRQEDYDTNSKTSSGAENIDKSLLSGFHVDSRVEEEDRGVLMNSTEIDFITVPTMEEFKTGIRKSNPRLPQYLCDRLGHEQLRRYEKLFACKVVHGKDVDYGTCLSGSLCSKKVIGEQGVQLSTREPKYIIRYEDLSDKTRLAAVTSAQFPPGVPLPPTNYLPAEFECHLCFRVKRFQKPSDWSKHVLEDLEPFTCTFSSCSEPKSFKRKADWVRHENERHRVLEWWECNQEGCEHKCFRRDNFVQHLVREHKMLEPKSSAKLLKPSLRGSSKHRKTLTDDEEKNSLTPDVLEMLSTCRHETTNKPTDEPCSFCGNVCNSWKKLNVHLARHMEQIALPVLKLVQRQAVTSDTIISPLPNPWWETNTAHQKYSIGPEISGT